ncbi:hypothetical protein [Moraxella marmotae]|uniref:hypothetical protein n=1 Tax=Moraxella marmotae TaxID=3344520 RepID=UPI0035F2497D
MSSFYSIHFAKRWLATPAATRQIFYDEFNDIIDLLESQEPAEQFAFRHADFNQAVTDATEQHKNKARPVQLVHAAPSIALNADDDLTLTPDMQDIESRLNKALATQVDEFLGEHMSQLSEDLRAWVQMAVRHELANYQHLVSTKKPKTSD